MLALFLAAGLSLAVMVVPRRSTYALYIASLLTTEFAYIEVGGGIARPYHLPSLIVIVQLGRYLPQLLRTRTAKALMAFVGINVVAVVMADRPTQAATSLLSLLANISVATSVALILTSGKVSPASLKRIVLIGSVACALWSLTQIAAARIGLVLSLSEQQASQIAIGFGPGFRTEANTLAKFLVVPLLLFLPDYLGRTRLRLGWRYPVIVVAEVANFTRSATLGLAAAAVYVLAWYARRGREEVVLRSAIKIGAVAAAVLILALTGTIAFSDYALYKVQNLWNAEELLAGGSSAHRIDMMAIVVSETLASTKRMLIGNGWGQTIVFVSGVEVQAGGGDIVNVFGYSGAMGAAAYGWLIVSAARAARRLARVGADLELSRFAAGSLFSLVAVAITAQMAGYLVAPEFWLLVGSCAFFDRYLTAPSFSPGSRITRGR